MFFFRVTRVAPLRQKTTLPVILVPRLSYFSPFIGFAFSLSFSDVLFDWQWLRFYFIMIPHANALCNFSCFWIYISTSEFLISLYLFSSYNLFTLPFGSLFYLFTYLFNSFIEIFHYYFYRTNIFWMLQ